MQQPQSTASDIAPRPIPGTPANAMEYRALVVRRGELGDQLSSANDRRHSLAEEVSQVNEAARPGIVERLKVLDARIIRLEQEIDQTGQAIADADPQVVQSARGLQAVTEIPSNVGNRIADEIVPLAGMFSLFFMLPIAIAFARLLWKRGSAPVRPALPDAASVQRLDQLQQSMDAMAIEVERISEGQRYVAKLFTEKDKERAALRA